MGTWACVFLSSIFLAIFNIAGLHAETINNEKRSSAAIPLEKIVLAGGEELNDELLNTLEAKFLKRSIDLELIKEIKKEICVYFESKHRPFVLVNVPEQDITQGNLKISLSHSKLSAVRCEGNRYFPCSTLKRYLSLHEEDPINTEILLANLSFINRNPFRKTDAFFLPGDRKNTTEINLVTQDRLPLRVYAGGDNTGNKYTGDARWFAGTNVSNPWLDHLISYQYTTSSDVSEFQSHTLHLLMPLPIQNYLIFYGGMSFVTPSLNRFKDDVQPPANQLRSSSMNAQTSMRYEIPIFKTWKNYYHQFTAGFDYKHLNNNLEYIGDEAIPIFYKTLNLSQFMGGYTYALSTQKHRVTIETEVFFSPVQMFSNGADHEFNIMRQGAHKQYVYGRFGLKEQYAMPHGLSFYGYLRAQGASGALIPSEQLGLGGYDTVRGYDERIFDADNALLANLELHSPSIVAKQQIYFLLFSDIAWGNNFHAGSEAAKNNFLASAGAGFRGLRSET